MRPLTAAWGIMALGLLERSLATSRLPWRAGATRGRRQYMPARLLLAATAILILVPSAARSQFMVRPSEPGTHFSMLPSDLAILEAGVTRKDLSCTVTAKKPEVGFDLRYH